MSDIFDQARSYLLNQMRDHFTDKTFSRYIQGKLAGDFAVEVASRLTALEAENAELRARVARYEQPPFMKCKECIYLKKPFPPHCMRGEEDTYCIHNVGERDESN